MRYIDIVPQVRHNVFFARIVMTDYDVDRQLVIRLRARKSDGLYKTEVIKYPENEDDVRDEILVPLFEMSKSSVAQILDARINGDEVRVSYNELESVPYTMARIDDSLTRISWESDMNNIDLKFDVINTTDPTLLQISDRSDWGILSDRPAIIEIKSPGVEDISTYYLGKNQINVFNHLTLGTGDDDKLPDGVYDITIKGSPSVYNFSRKYLKTDQIRLNIDKVWARANILCEHENKKTIDRIEEIEFMLAAAESNMRLGNEIDAEALYEKAVKLLYVLNNCEDCGCK